MQLSKVKKYIQIKYIFYINKYNFDCLTIKIVNCYKEKLKLNYAVIRI